MTAPQQWYRHVFQIIAAVLFTFQQITNNVAAKAFHCTDDERITHILSIKGRGPPLRYTHSVFVQVELRELDASSCATSFHFSDEPGSSSLVHAYTYLSTLRIRRYTTRTTLLAAFMDSLPSVHSAGALKSPGALPCGAPWRDRRGPAAHD